MQMEGMSEVFEQTLELIFGYLFWQLAAISSFCRALDTISEELSRAKAGFEFLEFLVHFRARILIIAF